MKRKLLILAALISAGSIAFAYNPPLGGENLMKFSNPELIGGAASASGGPLAIVVPASITYNPALAVLEQRVNVDLSFSVLLNTNKVDIEELGSDKTAGFAFQTGTIVPTKWFVYSGTMQGTFADFNKVDLRNSLIIHGGIAKEINEKLAVGMNLYSGFYMGTGSDFTLGADLGVLYKFDDFAFTKKAGSFINKTGFMTKPRLGIALLNCGKPTIGYDSIGIYGYGSEKTSSGYPGIFTPRVSFSANLINPLTKNVGDDGNYIRSKFNSAFSADLSFPTFQNIVFDCALGFTYDDFVNLNIGWQANMMELITNKTAALNWPSVSLSFRFTFNASKITGDNADWARSEIAPVLAWQNVYDGIQVISGEARINLGLADEQAPVILLWDEQ